MRAPGARPGRRESSWSASGSEEPDVAALFPRPGGFHVFRHSDKTVLGEPDTVQEAVELIVAELSDGRGPAVDGTPDDL
ncbi:DUF6193 family natural product biosynthesis protein [Streptomyces tanashiensis]|uniref:DUF6193 family natural product biosynthesis protein n=1 Tax=Streptomyces tanashiensis TaxID=67367 RepID=UPI00227D9043|nr:DUF6193 family natural product biosynthesis protein [Streptomyces tanashiensis]